MTAPTISTTELRLRRQAALARYDEVVPALERRIRKGEDKIAKATTEGHSTESAQARLEELKGQLRVQELMCEGFDLAYGFADLFKDKPLPVGSGLFLKIPGVIELNVEIGDQVPF